MTLLKSTPAPWACLILLASSACLPTFEDSECYSDFDCPGNQVCGDRVCEEPLFDAGQPDTGIADSSVDSGILDSGVVDTGVVDTGIVDTGVVDTGIIDTGVVDTGIIDTGVVDTGVADTGMPDAMVIDAGMPDAGFDVRLTPNSLDFGPTRIGCTVPPQQLTLQNFGPTAVEITSIGRSQVTSGEYAISQGRTAPFMLASGDSEQVTVTYTPQNIGIDTGATDATWGNPAQLVSSNLQGEGVVNADRTESFTQTAGPIDILFVVHNAPGSAGFQQNLVSDLTFLMLTLAFEGWDYQIGVTTADVSAMGAQGALLGTPTFLTAQDANVEMVLGSRITQGVMGALEVQGMEAARLALSAPLSTGANAGFLRTNAALLVIFLGNEDDTSPMTVSAYAGFLNGLKANANQAAANVIVSNRTFCSTNNGTAVYSGRYLGLAPLTGGVHSEICEPSFRSGVDTMPPIDRNRRFLLGAEAQSGSLQVRVDGNVVPPGAGMNWTFDGATNELVFALGQAPALGVSIQVDYLIVCN